MVSSMFLRHRTRAHGGRALPTHQRVSARFQHRLRGSLHAHFAQPRLQPRPRPLAPPPPPFLSASSTRSRGPLGRPISFMSASGRRQIRQREHLRATNAPTCAASPRSSMNSVRDASAFAVDASPRKDEVNRDRRALRPEFKPRRVHPAPRDTLRRVAAPPCGVSRARARTNATSTTTATTTTAKRRRILREVVRWRHTARAAQTRHRGVEQGTRLACPVFRRNRLRGLGGRSRRVRGETGTRAPMSTEMRRRRRVSSGNLERSFPPPRPRSRDAGPLSDLSMNPVAPDPSTCHLPEPSMRRFTCGGGGAR